MNLGGVECDLESQPCQGLLRLCEPFPAHEKHIYEERGW